MRAPITLLNLVVGDEYRVEKPEDLDKTLEKTFKADNPAIVDVIGDPESMTPIIKSASLE